MNEDKLKNDLKELKAEIGNLKDKEAVLKLEALTASIEQTLKSADFPAENDALIQGVQGNIEHFELEHPTITAILDRITKALSSMGI